MAEIKVGDEVTCNDDRGSGEVLSIGHDGRAVVNFESGGQARVPTRTLQKVVKVRKATEK